MMQKHATERIISARLCLLLSVTILAPALLSGCSQQDRPAGTGPAQSELAKHSDEFKKDIITVTEGVHVLVGYGLANVIVLEGPGACVLVDTMESAEAAARVKKDVDTLVKGKPLRAILYTHFHSDHTFGAGVFTENRNVDIYAHESTVAFLDRITSVTRETTFRRATRQFGTMLPRKDFVNSGIGPFLDFNAQSTVALKRPTKMFTGHRTELVLAGIRMVVVHAPGETDDQIFIWLPDKRVLLPADNFYRSFRNLYAIRGTAYRDVMKWVASLDEMRQLNAEYLVPSHTRPMTGSEQIYQALTDYRDAIQYVHDQTIRLINRGMTPQEIVEAVKLPEHLAQKPWLQEFYGTVAWSVRAIFSGYLGWFGGNATDLFPLPRKEKAARMADLAGGESALMDRAHRAFEQGDFQWSLELADHIIALDPDDSAARKLRSDCLRKLGELQKAATARNYYLTSSLEESGKLSIKDRKIHERDVVHSVPLEAIFRGMAVRLDPEKSVEVNRSVVFHFPDRGEYWTVTVRRGVAEISRGRMKGADTTVTVDSNLWKEIAAGMTSPVIAFSSGKVAVQGGSFDFVRFLYLFR
ncbi:MAG TPA: alkyl sulfatase dimerization domain-containing protein [Spirochaetota bacterium]|nr:alkyl sulfatase dimerization domain-containing protein [Spirochaetota bacterium]